MDATTRESGKSEPANQRASEPRAEKKTRNYTPTPPLPPPPPGVEVLTRKEAAAVLGLSLDSFTKLEAEGRVPLPRYRATAGSGRAIYYTRADVETLREERRREEEAAAAASNPHPHPDLPGVYRVPIRSRLHTMHALIDEQDLPKVLGKNWNWSPGRKAGTSERSGEVLLAVPWGSSVKQTPLKRVILGLEHSGKDVNIVFANGDPLDCRRANLVVRTHAEKNRARRRAETRDGRPVSSTYKGVTWDTTRRLWKAQAGSRATFRVIGRFRDEVEAALAYDEAARAIYGPGATVNFPGGPGTAPPRTFTGPDGQPVRKFNKYTVTPPLPPPPEGCAVMTREEGAEVLGVGESTFAHWEREGRIAIPQYRLKPVTGTPILYAVADLERLRDEFAKEGQPYADPADPTCWRVPIWTRKGYIHALIDEQDLPIVRGRVWNYVREKSVHGDERGCVILNGRRDIEHTPLKRLIMGVQDKGTTLFVVHANGDPLDCRRANLELRTPSQRSRRVFKHTHRKGEPCTSMYKGVVWDERAGDWRAQIQLNYRARTLGHFDHETDAARAYDEAAREVWGAEARVNFPEAGELPTALRDPHSTNPAVKSANESRRWAA